MLYANLLIMSRRGRTLIGTDQATLRGEFQFISPTNRDCAWNAPTRVNGYRSDFREVCGMHKGPGIVGHDFIFILAEWVHRAPYTYGMSDDDRTRHRIEQERLARRHIRSAFARGGVTTFHWHMNNPNTGRVEALYNEGPKAMWKIVPPATCRRHALLKTVGGCGVNHHKLETKFKHIINFFNSLTSIPVHKAGSKKPVMIPIVFRPFHEQNKDWFWWGAPPRSTPAFRIWQASFRAVWTWMVRYHAARGKHNVLWASSPNAGDLDREAYLAYSPPLRMVDVLGIDSYGGMVDRPQAVFEAEMVVALAESENKVAAVTELGYSDEPNEWPHDVWTRHTLGPVLDLRIAWALLWFNNPCTNQYWGPYKAHSSAPDFRRICNRPDVLLEGVYNFHAVPTVGYQPPPPDQPRNCTLPVSVECKSNGGRGYGDVEMCRGGVYCARRSAKSKCMCQVKREAKARNGYPYCIMNRGCGFGRLWPCSKGFSRWCAKTDTTYDHGCVSQCEATGTAVAKRSKR